MYTPCRFVCTAGLCLTFSSVALGAPPLDSRAARQEAEHLAQLPPVSPQGRAGLDPSGRKQRGTASYYAHHFANRKMADGKRMNPNDNVAASKTLPLGTTAKVMNLKNGQSATVKVEDRGPYVGGRVVDLSPKVGRDIGITHHGVVPVEVKPIAVPQKDGNLKLGAGAVEISEQELQQATETSRALSRRTMTAANR